MGAYKLIVGLLIIVLCSLIWIPMNYVFGLTGAALNGMLTDADAISRNNSVMQLYYWTLMIIIIAIFIWIVKPEKGEEEADSAYGQTF
jgi:hypothetical protein